MLSPASQSGFQTEMKAEEIGGGRQKDPAKKKKTSGRRNEEGEEEEMRANFLSIFITVHFSFLSVTETSQTSGSIYWHGHTNKDEHTDI